jgi:hypothetical protein
VGTYDPIEGDRRSPHERPERQPLCSRMTGSGSGAIGPGMSMIHKLSVLLLWSVLSNGCDAPHDTKPCEGLVYKEYGLSQNEYRPCAAAMVVALDRTEQHLVAVFVARTFGKTDCLRSASIVRSMIFARKRKRYE